MRLSRDANHTTCRTRTSVASLLALSVATLAKVVSATVHDDGAAKNALWADELDQLIGVRTLSVALAIGLEVAKVTNVTLLIRRCTVLLSVWVDWRRGLVE